MLNAAANNSIAAKALASGVPQSAKTPEHKNAEHSTFDTFLRTMETKSAKTTVEYNNKVTYLFSPDSQKVNNIKNILQYHANENSSKPHEKPDVKLPVQQLDTTNQVDLHYRAIQRMAGNDPDAQVLSENPQQRFLNNLNRLVRMEYQQYVKSEDPMYTRKNLREIMQAISQEVSQLQPRDKRDRRAERLEESRRCKDLNMKRLADVQEIFQHTDREEEERPLMSQVA
ncbi:MAG: hypothetical protein M1269_02555 [Chloroflexi bacterium]|nr:hypothetical protein [Chloroflexota bacterium]